MALDPTEFSSAMAVYLAATDHSIALRRGLESALPSGLLLGEPYYATDTENLWVGHGDGTAIKHVNADDLLEKVYPVGAIYTSVVSTSPATLFGGTWAAFGTGRMLIGIDAGDAKFNTVEETGGAETHTLTLAEMPATVLAVGGTSTDGLTATNKTINVTFGTATAIDIMNPYIVVYRWKRTA